MVRSLVQQDPLEEEVVTHSRILAMEDSMDREFGQDTIHGVMESGYS